MIATQRRREYARLQSASVAMAFNVADSAYRRTGSGVERQQDTREASIPRDTQRQEKTSLRNIVYRRYDCYDTSARNAKTRMLGLPRYVPIGAEMTRNASFERECARQIRM